LETGEEYRFEKDQGLLSFLMLTISLIRNVDVGFEKSDFKGNKNDVKGIGHFIYLNIAI